jgi:hypothetical protein
MGVPNRRTLEIQELLATLGHDPIKAMVEIANNPEASLDLRGRMDAELCRTFTLGATKDKDFAERLYADLQAKGVRCWFAPEDLEIGDKFRMRIDESIRIHDNGRQNSRHAESENAGGY